MNHAFTVSVPATSANLGPGFDSFGMALDWYNHFRFTPSSQDVITSVLPDVPLAPGENLVFEAIEKFFAQAKADRPKLQLHIDATIPLARGLGSSSTAIVAGIVAGNYLLGQPFSDATLCQMATEMEGHPDNVVPALLGGVKLYDDQVKQGSICIDLPWPEQWGIFIVVPPYPVKTDDARNVLPQAPTRGDAIFNLRKASVFTYALLASDETAFSQSLSDRIHQPYRGQLIPEWEELQTLSQTAGAYGTVISGSGPTIAMYYPKRNETAFVSALLQWANQKPGFIARAINLNTTGTQISLDK